MIKNSKKQKGANMVEYALLAALIAVVLIVSLRALSSRISGQFSTIGAQI
jgi:Flp pilus assembly pilin Flp